MNGVNNECLYFLTIKQQKVKIHTNMSNAISTLYKDVLWLLRKDYFIILSINLFNLMIAAIKTINRLKLNPSYVIPIQSL